MRKNFEVPIIPLRGGKPLTIAEENGGPVEATFGKLIVEALGSQYADEPNLSGQEKFKRGELMEKIIKAKGQIEVTMEEMAKIKELIGKRYGPELVLLVWKFIETSD